MISKLQDDTVVIEDPNEANKIHNKGYFGIPQSGGALKLEIIEAIYLLENNKIDIYKKSKRMKMDELITYATRLWPAFEIYYIVFRNLRSSGYVVKPDMPEGFNVYERGTNPKKNPSKYRILPLSERTPFILNDLVSEIKRITSLRKDLITAIVDEEGDLTYYRVELASPKSKMKRRKIGRKGTAVFLEDRIIVWDEKLVAQLHEYEFFGKLIGSSLQLSLMEGAHLLERGIIELRNARTNRMIGEKHFLGLARGIHDDFDLSYRVYRKLKENGLIAKTGFKYGTHFRVYKGDPDVEHSDYLVHAVPNDFSSTWPEISRAVRLAHGVRKEILFSWMVDDKLQSIKISRIRL